MGITGRKLVDSEVALIRKWTGEYGFDLSLIQEACSRTIAATSQPSFKYADSILTNWHKNQVHTLADIRQLDEDFSRKKSSAGNTAASGKSVTVNRNKFTNFSQRDYDYDKLERMALTTSVH
jgi:DnaD/phage-associated family protein